MNFIRRLFLGLIFSFVIILSVSAETLDDLSVSVVKKSSTEGGLEQSFIYVSNVSGENNYVYYSSSSDIPNTIDDTSLFASCVSSKLRDEQTNGLDCYNYTDVASLYGNIYVTVYTYSEGDSSGIYEKASNPILVERPTLPYGKRMDVGLYSSSNSGDIVIHDIYNRESNINVKVGEIKDEKILENFSLSKDYAEVLNYAKSDSEPVLTFSGNTYRSSSLDGKYDSSKIVDDKYYYIYLSVDTVSIR